jgi:hypothetical protein
MGQHSSSERETTYCAFFAFCAAPTWEDWTWRGEEGGGEVAKLHKLTRVKLKVEADHFLFALLQWEGLFGLIGSYPSYGKESSRRCRVRSRRILAKICEESV